MKNHIHFLILLLIALFSCEGSDSYQGSWKAMDSRGKKLEITFTPTNFSVKDSLGKTNDYKYSQNSVEYVNSVKTYGIVLDDGRSYKIYFPKKDNSIGMILDENGNPMFTISRKEYTTYEDVYKLD